MPSYRRQKHWDALRGIVVLVTFLTKASELIHPATQGGFFAARR